MEPNPSPPLEGEGYHPIPSGLETKLSYAAIVQGQSNNCQTDVSKINQLDMDSISLKPIASFQGKPSVLFKLSDKTSLLEKLKFVLVGKFSHAPPPLVEIKEFFAGLKLMGGYNLSIFYNKHMFIELDLKADYVKIWMKLVWFIKGFSMRIFKWNPEFCPSKESAIAPVWIRLEGLPLYLLDEASLLAIANAIGKPLRVDPANISRVKLNTTRICVELHVVEPLFDTIWIGFEDDSKITLEGFWFKVFYDEVPPFCSYCSHIGHDLKGCKRNKVGDLNGVSVNTSIVVGNDSEGGIEDKDTVTVKAATLHLGGVNHNKYHSRNAFQQGEEAKENRRTNSWNKVEKILEADKKVLNNSHGNKEGSSTNLAHGVKSILTDGGTNVDLKKHEEVTTDIASDLQQLKGMNAPEMTTNSSSDGLFVQQGKIKVALKNPEESKSSSQDDDGTIHELNVEKDDAERVKNGNSAGVAECIKSDSPAESNIFGLVKKKFMKLGEEERGRSMEAKEACLNVATRVAANKNIDEKQNDKHTEVATAEQMKDSYVAGSFDSPSKANDDQWKMKGYAGHQPCNSWAEEVETEELVGSRLIPHQTNAEMKLDCQDKKQCDSLDFLSKTIGKDAVKCLNSNMSTSNRVEGEQQTQVASTIGDGLGMSASQGLSNIAVAIEEDELFSASALARKIKKAGFHSPISKAKKTLTENLFITPSTARKMISSNTCTGKSTTLSLFDEEDDLFSGSEIARKIKAAGFHSPIPEKKMITPSSGCKSSSSRIRKLRWIDENLEETTLTGKLQEDHKWRTPKGRGRNKAKSDVEVYSLKIETGRELGTTSY